MKLDENKSSNKTSHFNEAWIFIDREIDMLNVIKLERTYIGMIYELFGIQHSNIHSSFDYMIEDYRNFFSIRCHRMGKS
jgi:hypothetical protein